MNMKDLFGGSEDSDNSAPKSNLTLIIIIVCILLFLIIIIGYFIYNASKKVASIASKPVPSIASKPVPSIASKPVSNTALGGTLVSDGPYNYHIFTQNDNIKFNGSGQVEYLIIGGGGSGGNGHGGGGGAGRVISGNIDIIGKSYPVVVGNGGIKPIPNSTKDCKGQNSSVFDIIAEGGGYGGGDRTGPALSGGSGGGGSGWNDTNNIINNKADINGGLANGSIGLGSKGGNGNQDNRGGGGGGGGGSGSEGENGESTKTSIAQGGKGGSGTNKYSDWLSIIKKNMSKTWIDATVNGYIAAGGGGGSWTTAVQLGGNGGGGIGGSWQGDGSDTKFNIDPTEGVSNTGSGGGGGGSNWRLGASGGSGLVIIRYKN